VRIRTLLFRSCTLWVFLIAVVGSREIKAVEVKPTMAFLQFVTKNVEAISLMSKMPTLLSMAFGRTGYFEIVERKNIERGIELEGYNISRIKMEELIKVGNKLGVDYIVFGDVEKERGAITAVVKVLDIRLQRVCFEYTISATEGSIHDRINDAVPIIVKQIRKCISVKLKNVEKDNIPDPPRDLRATSRTGQVRIEWSYDNPQNIIGFKVYRAREEGGPYLLIGTVFDTSFVDKNLPLKETFFYKIKAVDDNGVESTFSELIQARSIGGPLPPIFLSVESDIKATQLKWMARPGSNLAGFKVYRKEINEQQFKEVASLSGNVTTYTDTGLRDGTTYRYALTAIDSEGIESEFSQIIEEKTPEPPTGVKAKGGRIRRIYLTWSAYPSSVFREYRIYRAKNRSGDYKLIARIKDRTKTSYLDKGGLDDNTTYYYRISVTNRAGLETDMSEAVSATTRGKPPMPQMFAAKSREPRRVTLTWKPTESPLDEIRGYSIFRSKEVSGEYTMIARIKDPKRNMFIDKDPPLEDNTTYYYRISSYNSVGVSSDLAGPISSTTKSPPVAPKGLKAISGEVKRVTLIWEPNPEEDIREYIILRKVPGAKAFKKIATVRTKTAFTDTGLKDGGEYIYTIKAIDDDNLVSEQAPPVTAVTKPRPVKPTGLKVYDKNGKRVLEWNPNPEKDIKCYNIYKKGLLGSSQKVATVHENSWVIDEITGKMEMFVTAVDETGLESNGSDPVVIEKEEE